MRVTLSASHLKVSRAGECTHGILSQAELVRKRHCSDTDKALCHSPPFPSPDEMKYLLTLRVSD